MVPMLICGLFLSNFCFAISKFPPIKMNVVYFGAVEQA
jgi:hypothetical protein